METLIKQYILGDLTILTSFLEKQGMKGLQGETGAKGTSGEKVK